MSAKSLVINRHLMTSSHWRSEELTNTQTTLIFLRHANAEECRLAQIDQPSARSSVAMFLFTFWDYQHLNTCDNSGAQCRWNCFCSSSVWREVESVKRSESPFNRLCFVFMSTHVWMILRTWFSLYLLATSRTIKIGASLKSEKKRGYIFEQCVWSIQTLIFN